MPLPVQDRAAKSEPPPVPAPRPARKSEDKIVQMKEQAEERYDKLGVVNKPQDAEDNSGLEKTAIPQVWLLGF
jgi:hypothetical protein